MSTETRPRGSSRCAAPSHSTAKRRRASRWSLAPALIFGSVIGAVHAAPAGPGLGRPLLIDDIAEISIHAFPDGSGLPQGRGTAAEGREIYQRQCAACHGPNGIGGSAEELAGAKNALTDDPPDKTIGTYWPYATTLFDYIRRSMPLNAPRSLTADQVYALTAYLLFLNGIIEQDRVLDASALSKIRMPNRNGFIPIYQPGER